MRFNKQTLFVKDHGRGNCYQAALASVLGVEMYEMVDISLFYELDQFEKECNITWEKILLEFIKAKFNKDLRVSISLTEYHREKDKFDFPSKYKDIPYLLFGRSPRGNFNHVVVFKNGVLIHDPHPDNTGLDMSDEEIYVKILE